MNTINCDINHIEEAIEAVKEQDNPDRIHVWDSDCVMRGIGREEMKERNIFATNPREVCRIEHRAGDSFTLHFHQSQVSYTQNFCFNARDSTTATKPKQMGENLKILVDELEKIYRDLIWDFAGVEAQSYGRDGELTDYEFEYDLIAY